MCSSIQPVRSSRTEIESRQRVAGLLRVLPEAPAVVDRTELLAQLILGHALEHDPAPEQHLAEAGPLLLQERDELERQVEAVLGVEAADLERRDDAHRPVVLAAVSVRVAVRTDAEHLLASRPVARHERADGILLDVEAEVLQRLGEVVERVAVDVRVGVPPNGFVRERVFGAGQRLDVPLDALGALCAVELDGLGDHAEHSSIRRWRV
jgi:hypothetical protein